ncbi:helix-turn-helix domain-containing protein [Longitalea arenae]|uniref:helix-turn-helix domain-containing protein n=1 Tax=Longitalea arenae TaxID=2812558 RepID=UPI0019681F5D|nr:helix-turn-helix transcriptional regulator [Longitalea arenae]
MLNTKPYSSYVLAAINSIKKHIDTDPFRYRSAADLLEEISSPHRNSVEKAFKEVYGYRIKEYQVKQRLQIAKLYLKQGLSKKQVATKCFYGSSSAFCTAFKKEFGMAPTEWEKAFQEHMAALDNAKR